MAGEVEILSTDVSPLNVRSVTVADGTAINKGTFIVVSSDPNTGIAHSAGNEIPMGVAAADKKASDGETTLGVIVRGDVDAVAQGAITLGDLVVLSTTTANAVASVGTTLSGATVGQVVGRCLETATDGERVRIRLLNLG